MTIQTSSSSIYSPLGTPPQGTTETGLDQIITMLGTDSGLLGANEGENIRTGIIAANKINKLIVKAIKATGSGVNGEFTVDDVVNINAWIRENHLEKFTGLHGDDEGNQETGFHLLQNNGAIQRYQGNNLVDTVIDGLYHIGFPIENGVFLNEDGDANASVADVAQWLTEFFTDYATTNTGLDRITELIIADQGLTNRISWQEIAEGADAANSINELYQQGISELNLDSDGWISENDIIEINNWIRSDATRYQQFVDFHGDDENQTETGYHLVQNDGANTRFFGENLVNTVADGLYHIGFEIQDGQFRNEDGNANATVADVADWINYFYTDQSTTGTGLDQIVDTIKLDSGLARNTNAGDINEGAEAANSLNHLIVEAIEATGIDQDGWITTHDVRNINYWIRTYNYDTFMTLHGDDEGDRETGYHLVQNDGAKVKFLGNNLINTVADGIYHIGFAIEGDRLLNEDGNANASLSSVSSWLNYFYGGKSIIYGSHQTDYIIGTSEADHIIGKGGNDTIDGGKGDDLIEGSWGKDVLSGGAGNDILEGNGGDDFLDGGKGSDHYLVSGTTAKDDYKFEGYDTYSDSGAQGTDVIVAVGDADVDIGLINFAPDNGIEEIDATEASGTVRLLGNWQANQLDFSAVTMTGDNLVIDGGGGHDTVIGSQKDDLIFGGSGNDELTGGAGFDQLTGESGRDTFIFSSIADIGKGLFKDIITDFSTKKDLIDLSQIDANPVLADDQAFIYISDAEFTGQIGELRFASNILSGDIDGDQLSDFELGMDGVSSLNSSDIVL
ncbi:MAG: calcium-binding protein [Microcystaceae cyanobacterium]